MFKCRKIQPKLSAFIDDELLDSERAEVESHLEACGKCQGDLEQLNRTKALLKNLGAAKCDRVKALVEHSASQAALEFCCKPFRLRTFAAAVLSIVILWAGADRLSMQDNHAGPPVSQAAMVPLPMPSSVDQTAFRLEVKPKSAVGGAPESYPCEQGQPQCIDVPISRGTAFLPVSYKPGKAMSFGHAITH